MIALYIVLGILILFLLFLFIPIYLNIYFYESLCIRIRFLFLRFKFCFDEKQGKVIAKSKNIKKEKNILPKERKNKDIIKNIISLIKMVKIYIEKYLDTLLSHIIIKKLKLKVEIAGEDAAETAVNYGKVCALVYPTLSFLCNKITLKRKEINVFPNFYKEDSSVEFEAEIKARPIYLLISVLPFFKEYIKFEIKNKQEGVKNERTPNR